ncbi:MAG: type II toxin-antitoxin system RelE/ParE family toxin [Terrimicrobiaceae bacterium]
MRLVLTEAALADLRSISDYTLATWGEEQEKRYISNMWSRLESLQLDPASGRRRDDLFPGCRLVSEGRHVILFRSSPGVLEVVRVLHSAMDFKRQVRLTQ